LPELRTVAETVSGSLYAARMGVLLLTAFAALALLLAAMGVYTRSLESSLYGISGQDPFTFVAVALILTSVAFVACLVPARRAMKLDPLAALRYR
jgi:ABC-type lipoprotein release transport system permease subunit